MILGYLQLDRIVGPDFSTIWDNDNELKDSYLGYIMNPEGEKCCAV